MSIEIQNPLDPLKEEFVAIVTNWHTYSQRGSVVGSAIPVFCTTRHALVEKPNVSFPDPGYVFLVNRGTVVEWDWVIVRPKKNDKYVPGKSVYLSFEQPTPIDLIDPTTKVASLLDLASFDPLSIDGLIRNPPQNVLPLFYVRVNQKIYGPLKRIKVNRKVGGDALESIQWAPWGEDAAIYEFTEEELAKQQIHLWVYQHPNPDDEAVARSPIHLLQGPVTAVKSDRAYDRLSSTELAEWFLRWREMPPIPNELLKTFRSAPEYLANSPPDIIRQRCRRLALLFGSLDLLQHERNSAITRYIESETGQKLIQAQVEQELERRSKQIDEELAQLKKEQSKERYRLKQEADSLHQEQQKRQRLFQDEMNQLESQKLAAEQALQGVRKQLQENLGTLGEKLQSELPILAALVAALAQPR